jgi:hypothetical protein
MGKLLRASPANLRGLAVAYWYLGQAGWRLFVRKERLDHWVMVQDATPNLAEVSEKELQFLCRKARWINAAAHRPKPWARCLQRSLALCIWLEQKGIHPQLKIGVNRQNSTLDAHAWVEYAGRVINDRPEVKQHFATLNVNSPHLPRMGR